MQALALWLTVGALQLLTAVQGGPQQQRFVAPDITWSLSKVQNFAWENCGPPSEPAIIKSLSVSPDPIAIPGDVTVAASGASTILLSAPLKAVVILEKKLGEMWIKIPCVDDVGSCTYDDVCALLDSLIPPGQPCPQPLQSYGLPCHCPFKAGTYNLPSSEFFIPNMDLPSFLTNGDYRVRAVLSNGDQELSCTKLSFSLQAEKRWLH
ncbi:putative Ganglioside GM2 activator protein [Naja naja]|uniref:Ganglioside GM2 activator n=1 Tax=Naja naja TaxID=35670 RepID=A0A8C6XW67_NAJNA|nr:putative Ganglioside GM2 activator protein [Naja naja]